MSESLSFLDLFLFVVLPYAAVAIAIIGTIERYRSHPYSISSQSSQFLENRAHFWAETPFHYGIILVLVGHVILMIVPGTVLALVDSPRWLFAIEAVGLALGFLAGVGLIVITARRALTPAVRGLTRAMDWVTYALLLAQVASGVPIALLHSWGSAWFASVLSPYLWSLARFQPDASAVAAMPWLIKTHVAAAFVIVAVLPFSRLVHVVAIPTSYLWRRPQVVRWRRHPAASLEKRP